mmetsp:Transcript_21189/g.64655  ORF Transcript_21189/g.64655 Transcript_21189/m.64655 type:complete len:128 (-) Transcript_21189:1525-1908(-)
MCSSKALHAPSSYWRVQRPECMHAYDGMHPQCTKQGARMHVCEIAQPTLQVHSTSQGATHKCFLANEPRRGGGLQAFRAIPRATVFERDAVKAWRTGIPLHRPPFQRQRAHRYYWKQLLVPNLAQIP